MKLYEWVLKLRDQASPALKTLKTAAGSAGDEAVRTTKKVAGLNNEVGRMPSVFSSAKSAVVGFLSIAAVVSFGNNVLTATARMDGYAKSIQFSSGSALEASKNTAFLNSWIDEAGLNAEASFRSFQLLNGGLMGFQNQGQLARDVFQGVTMAASAFNLPAEQAEGAILALSQIAGKGKVSMEELRGQLGERIPGAMQIGARAMGVTGAEFEKMVASGISAQVFLPKFAAELKKTFAGTMPEASASLTSNINRLGNAITRAYVALGTEFKPQINAVLIGLGKMITFVSQNRDLIISLIKWVSYGAIVWTVYSSGLVLAVAWTKIQVAWATIQFYWHLRSVAGITLVRNAQLLLNAAWAANPIGLVIVAFAALAGIVFYAWNNFEGFRGAVVGVWESIRQLGKNIMELFMPVMTNLMKSFEALKNGDWTAAAKFGAKAAVELQLLPAKTIGAVFSGELTKGVAEAYRKGDAAGRKMGPVTLGSITGFGGFTPTTNGDNPAQTTDQNQPAGMSDVTGGGSKPLNVSISFRNFIEELKIESASTAEAFDQTERRLQDMFGRLIDGAVSSVGR
jgi:tape measure domain-containing protein